MRDLFEVAMTACAIFAGLALCLGLACLFDVDLARELGDLVIRWFE